VVVPSRWLIRLRVEEPRLVKPDHLHAVVCGWLEPGDERSHAQNRKSFSITPLRPVAGGMVGFEVGLLDDGLTRRLLAGVRGAQRRGIRLGRQRAVVERADDGPARLQAYATWEDLLGQAFPAAGFGFRFLTPTVFRSGRAVQPFPLPSMVFGHLRDRWRAFGPDGSVPRVAFGEAGVEVRAFACESCTLPRGDREVVGVTGLVEFAAPRADVAERTALDALGRLAPFAGVGANTTVGMGVTRYQPYGEATEATAGGVRGRPQVLSVRRDA
jgi:CRISPR-associated endoribonuclease Cas6